MTRGAYLGFGGFELSLKLIHGGVRARCRHGFSSQSRRESCVRSRSGEKPTFLSAMGALREKMFILVRASEAQSGREGLYSAESRLAVGSRVVAVQNTFNYWPGVVYSLKLSSVRSALTRPAECRWTMSAIADT